MTREEITNSQDYKATKIALCWYPTLSDKQREDMDIVDAYSDGIIYGWNNPNWISVEDQLPPYNERVLVFYGIDRYIGIAMLEDVVGQQTFWNDGRKAVFHITHWMPIVPPRKEERYDSTRRRSLHEGRS